jgi:hypothetical protein
VGFDALFAPSVHRRRRLWLGLSCVAVIAVGWAVVYAWREPLLALIERTSAASAHAIDAKTTISTVLDGGMLGAASALLVPLAIASQGRTRWLAFMRPCFVGFALLVLVLHDWSVHVLLARDLVRKTPAILADVQPPTAGEWPRLMRRARDAAPVSYSGEVRGYYTYQIASENQAVRFGFAQVPGYSVTGSKRFDTFATASGKANLERAMDLLDVRYLVIEANQAAAMRMPVVSPAMVAGHVVLDNKDRRPRAFVAYRFEHGLDDQQIEAKLFAANRADVDLGAIRLPGDGPSQRAGDEPPSPCAIERPVPERVVMSCNAAHAGYAVLLDESMAGWTATVDGHPARIERADLLFRAVAIPAGQHIVEMRYRTPGLRTGAVTSLGGWLLFALLVAFRKRWAIQRE